MMETNYDRLEAENRRLRGRVAELERAVFGLQRRMYELQKEVKGREITEFLEHYKPKDKTSNGI